jgi:hypothetical protein
MMTGQTINTGDWFPVGRIIFKAQRSFESKKQIPTTIIIAPRRVVEVPGG